MKSKKTRQVKQEGPFERIERLQLERREIVLFGQIDNDMAYSAGVKLRYLAHENKRPITLVLNTPGGSVIDGMSLYDAITYVQEMGCDVRVVCTGACMSMGTIVLQAANERLCTPNAVFMLHELSMVNAGSLGQLKDRHNEAERLQRMLNDILMKRSGVSKDQLSKLIERRDLYLTAQEARKYNFIDDIVGSY